MVVIAFSDLAELTEALVHNNVLTSLNIAGNTGASQTALSLKQLVQCNRSLISLDFTLNHLSKFPHFDPYSHVL